MEGSARGFMVACAGDGESEGQEWIWVTPISPDGVAGSPVIAASAQGPDPLTPIASLAAVDDGYVLAWTRLDSNWIGTVPLDSVGEPSGEPFEVFDAATAGGGLARGVRVDSANARGGPAGAGLVMLTQDADGHRVSVVRVTATGEPLGEPLVLADRLSGWAVPHNVDIAWADPGVVAVYIDPAGFEGSLAAVETCF
jgi:hypothetical protein